MKITVIPDVHGDNFWEEIVSNNPDSNLYVFLGDYVDSHVKTNVEILDNLNKIIKFKLENMNKVILLMGNHDNQYLYYGSDLARCSGLRPEIAIDIQLIFVEHHLLFQNAFQYGKHIFTHAGIADDWFVTDFCGCRDKNIANQLNNPTSKRQFNSLLNVGYMRGGMNDCGGIFWCDKDELVEPLFEFIQVVGHTRLDQIETLMTPTAFVYFTDCKQNPNKILTLEINE